MVRDRIRSIGAAGINTLRIGPIGRTPTEQIANLERTVATIREASANGTR